MSHGLDDRRGPGGSGDRTSEHEVEVGAADPPRAERFGRGIADRDTELPGRGEAIAGIAREPAHGDVGEPLGHSRRDLEERGGLLVHAPLEHLDGSPSIERGNVPDSSS